MLRFVALFSVVVALMLSCGGESVRAGDGHAQRGGASAGGAVATGGVAAGGASTTGGTVPTGGASGAGGFVGGPCSAGDEIPSGSCIRTCYEEVNYTAAPECRDDIWQCPAGLVLQSTCPEYACANKKYNVCCSNLGVKSSEPCDARGERQPCPAETERIEPGSMCLAEGVDAAHCRELEGRPCSGPDVHCSEGSGCASNGCDCQESPEGGGYTWSCWVVLC